MASNENGFQNGITQGEEYLIETNHVIKYKLEGGVLYIDTIDGQQYLVDGGEFGKVLEALNKPR